MNEPTATLNRPPPAWWPLSVVLPEWGLSRRMAVRALELGQLPVRHERFGSRGQVFVCAADAAAYTNDLKHGSAE